MAYNQRFKVHTRPTDMVYEKHCYGLNVP